MTTSKQQDGAKPAGPPAKLHKPNPNKNADEHSPLLSGSPSTESLVDDGLQLLNDLNDMQATKSTWYLILLTISLGGLQIAWSVEMSNGSPYLMSLGLSKSLMALVWIAGPLTGTLVQPYIGMLSDNCRLPMGRRKPFMLGGTAATVVALMFLAWLKELITGIVGLFGADPDSQGVKNTIIVGAVIGIYVLDVAINTVQAAVRAFIVDCAPTHQQEAANAMASRILGSGNIIGYVAGYANLPKYFWFLGNSQFKVLCAIASVGLASTILLSVAVIPERNPRLDGPAPSNKPNVLAFFATIFQSINKMPPQIYRVCQVEVFAWIGFFPLLFYTSSYIGELYVQPHLRNNPHMSPEELERLYEEATRIGTYALLINSIVSLVTNMFLPFFISPTYDSRREPEAAQGDAVSRRAESRQSHFLEKLQIPGLTLRRAWFGSLVLFAGSMFCTTVVTSVNAATVLIGLAGITWAMALWAPWAIISAEISQRDATIRVRKARAATLRSREGPTASRSLDDSPHHLLEDGEKEEEVDEAGVILGIHNMAIAAPQIIATMVSSIIFRIWQKPRGEPGDFTMTIVYSLGGLCTLVSSVYVIRIQETTSAEVEGTGSLEQDGYQD